MWHRILSKLSEPHHHSEMPMNRFLLLRPVQQLPSHCLESASRGNSTGPTHTHKERSLNRNGIRCGGAPRAVCLNICQPRGWIHANIAILADGEPLPRPVGPQPACSGSDSHASEYHRSITAVWGLGAPQARCWSMSLLLRQLALRAPGFHSKFSEGIVSQGRRMQFESHECNVN